jgi:CRISPR-associated protein Csb2
MSQNLVLTIRLHDQRYHGSPSSEWPPAPGRLFQALVAGAARGDSLPKEVVDSLEWLERLPPPIIAAPRALLGNRVELYVPNNDLDAVDGDPDRIGEIRTKKAVHPQLLESDSPLFYTWHIPEVTNNVTSLIAAANNLYQLGRGVDMAWAYGEVVDDVALADRFDAYRGEIHEPDLEGTAGELQCPTAGSLDSLQRRHLEASRKFIAAEDGRSAYFAQPSKPIFAPVSYAKKIRRQLYELRDVFDPARFISWSATDTVTLTELLRRAAARKLRRAMPHREAEIDAALLDTAGTTSDASAHSQRILVLPIPSIGHTKADRGIRRVLVETRGPCTLSTDDVHWAFSGLQAGHEEKTAMRFLLAPADDKSMLQHYTHRSRVWRSVTAIALPANAKRRRISPERQREEAKSAGERIDEETRAAEAIAMALREAGARAAPVSVKVQREPFEPMGARAESFARKPDLLKEQLWHAEVVLRDPVEGPLVIGDGREFGLGLMEPLAEASGIVAFAAESQDEGSFDAVELARAFRRAVMSRVQRRLGRESLPPFLSGHDPDGAPLRTKDSAHVAFHWDPYHRRLLLIAPHLLDHRAPTKEERKHLETLETALDGMTELLAGKCGRYELSRCAPSASDDYCGTSQEWAVVSPYTVTRHRKASSALEALSSDVLAECVRLQLPAPKVDVLAIRGAAGVGLQGKLRLSFPVAIEGPLVLGRSRFLGGGLFVRAGERGGHAASRSV